MIIKKKKKDHDITTEFFLLVFSALSLEGDCLFVVLTLLELSALKLSPKRNT